MICLCFSDAGTVLQLIHILLRMRRASSKLSFWVLRPTENRDQIHIQLPLLSREPTNPSNPAHAHQIRCLSADYRIKQAEGRIDAVLRKYGQKMDKFNVIIHPQSWGLLAWNLLVFLFTFLTFIEIPIALLLVEDSYYEIYQNRAFTLCYYLILDVFIYDMIVVRPRVSYEQDGKNMSRNEDILRYYLRNFFWIDFLGIVVMIVSFLPIRHIDYLRFFFFLKIFPLREINRQIKFKLLIKRFSSALFEFLKLVFFIVFVTNFYACIYFAIDYHYYKQQGFFYENGYLWINGTINTGYLDIVETFGHSGAYVYALFWALETARTCGYGVATPKNYVEMLYVNFVMLTIVIIFVYFTNGVITLIITHGEHRRKKLNTIKRVVDVSQQFEVDRKSRNRIVEYLTDFENPEEELEQYMDRSLSPALNNQFKVTFRRHFINLIEMVTLVSCHSAEEELFKIDLANIIKHRHYQMGQFVYQAKQIKEPTLFLIERGVCTIENSEVGYRKFQSQWAIIGKREFYFEKMPIYTVIANEYLQGLEINRKEFVNILKPYSAFYQKFREIMDNVVVSQHGTEDFHIKCAFCNNYHLHEHCQTVNRWRINLRIHNAGKESQEIARRDAVRLSLRSARVTKLRLERPEMERAYRATHYFTHYNI